MSLPAKGGSYVRQPDGVLKRTAWTKPPASKLPPALAPTAGPAATQPAVPVADQPPAPTGARPKGEK